MIAIVVNQEAVAADILKWKDTFNNMQANINIRIAHKKDFNNICQLLSEENLPVSDINPLLENFFVAIEGNTVTGVIGIEKYVNTGLLRSAIVKEAYRNTGIATALINQLFNYAKSRESNRGTLSPILQKNILRRKGLKKLQETKCRKPFYNQKSLTVCARPVL